jgi:hypothetical protein
VSVTPSAPIPGSPAAASPSQTHVAPKLAVPRISWERVIRTTVGLRPHRDSGFVLRAENFGEKTVFHDYAFGGAGMSRAWGCGAMVADMALEHNERKAAVLGCGSPGLTAARPLQRRGFEVTIYGPLECPVHIRHLWPSFPAVSEGNFQPLGTDHVGQAAVDGWWRFPEPAQRDEIASTQHRYSGWYSEANIKRINEGVRNE